MPQPEKLDERLTDETGGKHSFARSARGATGPRTVQGKQRSRHNAIKRGIFAKNILLKHESAVDFESVLSGLRQDFQPQGTLETLLVENLAVLIWRKRRFLQAEAAEMANVVEFKTLDSFQAQATESWDRSRAGEISGGMLRDCSNPFVVEEAIRILTLCRSTLQEFGFCKDADHFLFRKLYGLDYDGTVPLGIFRTFQLCTEFATQAPNENNPHSPDELKKAMIETFDAEIRRLEFLKASGLAIDKQRREYQTIAALVPSPIVMERFLRYENHLSREFDRTLHQLERLQRIRSGQPVPPSLRVELSR